MDVALVLLPNYQINSPSLALAYLASNLIKKGHTVSRFEFNLKFKNKKWIKYIYKFNQNDALVLEIMKNPQLLNNSKFNKLNSYIDFCVKKILSKSPKVIGFSTYYTNKNISLFIAKKIKEINYKIKIVFGGPFTFVCDDIQRNILKTKWVDYIIIGEGEQLFIDLLKKLKSFEKKSKCDKQILSTNSSSILKIDDIEFPLFRKKEFKLAKYSNIIPIIASRGCIGKCDFCMHPKLWNIFRQRKPENVIAEIKYQIKTLNIFNFVFNDSLFNANPVFIEKFCNMLINENISIKWLIKVRISENLSDSMLKLMYKAGCRFLLFGIESFSNKVLNKMNKGINTDMIYKNLELAHKNKFRVHIYIIIGHPSETKKDFQKTIKGIKNCRNLINSITINKLTLHPKTELFKHTKNLNHNKINERLIYLKSFIKKMSPPLKYNCDPIQIFSLKYRK
jgi:anaerobic magnesium-protoporphyrin IX monomethyl ester cyclase